VTGARKRAGRGRGVRPGQEHEREHEHRHGHEHGHHEHGHGPYDRHRNPVDLGRYLERLEGPDRAAWQMPDRVVKALRLAPGSVCCDLGVGPGYFALRLARAVGPEGTVYAIDVEPRMIEQLTARAREAGLENVRPVLAATPRGALPPRRCDLILVVNTYHHLPGGAAHLRRLAARLAPGGRIVNVDFHARETPVGPPVGHRVAREDFLAAAREAGLRVRREHRFLPYQYFVELEPVTRPGRGSAPGRGAPARAAPRAAPGPARRRPAPRSTRSPGRSRRSSRTRGRSPGPGRPTGRR
jgi:SAM-dependent methyltransferase